MTAEDLNVLSDDLSRNTVILATAISNVAMLQGNMRWGEDMFGSETILGGAYTNHYELGARFVAVEDLSWNIVRL